MESPSTFMATERCNSRASIGSLPAWRGVNKKSSIVDRIDLAGRRTPRAKGEIAPHG
jgi:hypothetical protein